MLIEAKRMKAFSIRMSGKCISSSIIVTWSRCHINYNNCTQKYTCFHCIQQYICVIFCFYLMLSVSQHVISPSTPLECNTTTNIVYTEASALNWRNVSGACLQRRFLRRRLGKKSGVAMSSRCICIEGVNNDMWTTCDWFLGV